MTARQKMAFRRGLVPLVGVGVVFFAVSGSLRWLAFPNTCVNSILMEVLAPNRKLKAVLFSRDCGATTSFGTHVSIPPASSRLPDEGGSVVVVRDEPKMTIRWIDDRHLNISGSSAGAAFLRLPDFRGVRITYD
jgi:hypothetical protein